MGSDFEQAAIWEDTGNSSWKQVQDMWDCIRDQTSGYWLGPHPDNSVSVGFCSGGHPKTHVRVVDFS